MISGKKAELLAMYASKSAKAQPFTSTSKGSRISDTTRAKGKSRFGPPPQEGGSAKPSVLSQAITPARKVCSYMCPVILSSPTLTL